LMRTIPQAGPRLAAGLALFAEAVQSGNSKQVAGDGVVKGLDKAGRRDLAGRLKKDFDSLADEAARPLGPAADWRGLTMPFLNGATIDPIRLYVRHPPEDEEGGGGKSGGHEHRFILDITMTRLGRIQLDGLIQRGTNRFDLVMRTGQPLSDGMRQDIAGIFAECGQLTGAKGSISFQTGGRFVELPPTDSPETRIMV
jgi:hypothetical protein